MSFVIASQVAQWAAILVLAVVCIALARQVGVLHQRIAPAGALSLRQPLKLGEPTPEMSLPALDGSTVKIGGVRGGRSQLRTVPLPGLHGLRGAAAGGSFGAGRGTRTGSISCWRATANPSKHAQFVGEKGLTKFPYVISEHLGRTFGVAKLPYAVLIDEAGKLSATGLVNTREHLESLFVAKETGVSNIQQFLGSRDQRRASSGE